VKGTFMRTTLGLAIFFLTQAACTPGNGPLYIEAVRVAGPGCIPPKLTDPSLNAFPVVDVAASPSVDVFAQVGGFVFFFGSQRPLGVTMNPNIADRNRERIVIRSVLLRYSSKPAISGLSGTRSDTVSDTVLRSGLITPQTTNFQIPIPLFGANALAKLEALVPSNTDKFEFTSTFELRGVTEPSGAEIRTPPVSIPMTLVKSEVTCRATPKDQRLMQSGLGPVPGCAASTGFQRRYTENDCCAMVDAAGDPSIDVNTPGCDVIP